MTLSEFQTAMSAFYDEAIAPKPGPLTPDASPGQPVAGDAAATAAAVAAAAAAEVAALKDPLAGKPKAKRSYRRVRSDDVDVDPLKDPLMDPLVPGSSAYERTEGEAVEGAAVAHEVSPPGPARTHGHTGASVIFQ